MPTINKQTTKPTRRVNGIMSGVMGVADLPDTGLKFLIFGNSGTGKTTLACSFPKPLLLVRPEQVEDGSRSVRNVKGVDVTPSLTSAEQLDEVIEAISNGSKYKTVVLDGVGKFQDLVLKKILGLKEVPAQLSWGIADQRDWGTVSNELKEYLRKLLNLADSGTHIAIVGGERALGVGDDDRASMLVPNIMVALTPSSMGWLHEVCDYNVHTFIRRKVIKKKLTVGKMETITEEKGKGCEFCLHVGPHELYNVKFRVSKGTQIPECLVDPDFSKIQELIEGG